jgi:menaquinone-dependent protoporphyrinogen IX oxidase
MSSNNSQENKTLIVYSSGAGCTQEVALKIKEKLDNSSIKTNIVKINDKDQFKSLDQQDLTQYSSILLGSSIIKGNFHKNINKILEKLTSTSGENKKLGFFVCCMKACNPEKILEAKNQYIEPNLKEYGLDFSLVDAFGGMLDFSPESSMNFMLKKILKSIMLKDNSEMKEIEPKVYDFRDWQQIDNFASSWLNIIRNG